MSTLVLAVLWSLVVCLLNAGLGYLVRRIPVPSRFIWWQVRNAATPFCWIVGTIAACSLAATASWWTADLMHSTEWEKPWDIDLGGAVFVAECFVIVFVSGLIGTLLLPKPDGESEDGKSSLPA